MISNVPIIKITVVFNWAPTQLSVCPVIALVKTQIFNQFVIIAFYIAVIRFTYVFNWAPICLTIHLG